MPAGGLGRVVVRVGDSVAPTATLAPSTVNPGGPYHWFTVTYADNTAVNYATIDNSDVLVSGPGGYSQLGVLSNLTVSGGVWRATYRIVPPGGTWNAADNGTYTVNMQAGQVCRHVGQLRPRRVPGNVRRYPDQSAAIIQQYRYGRGYGGAQTLGEVVGVTPARRKPIRRTTAFLA